LKKVTFTNFLLVKQTLLLNFHHNWITCSAKPKVKFDFQTFYNDWNQLSAQVHMPIQPPTSAKPVQNFLWERKKKINYRSLHLGHYVQQAATELK
jgi:hypothetical protein